MSFRPRRALARIVVGGALGAGSVGVMLVGASAARAQADAGVLAGGADARLVRPRSACVEHVPEGKQRPEMQESFPARGRAGYAAVLRVVVPHGLGETVLPGGFKLKLDSPEGKALEQANFVIPALEGPAAPRITHSVSNGEGQTVVELSFVPLPKEPGPHTLTLPSVPIAIARASGELITLCTAPHAIDVDDPTANIANATPRRNPRPLRQLEVWTAAKNVALGALVALPLGILIALLVSRFLRRPRPLPPPPPPRPAWEVALEALSRIRKKRLIEQGQTTQLFAEVSLALRDYLGRRFDFDGLESTTREILERLDRQQPPAPLRGEIESLLRRSDLVKFANLTPEAAECELALERGEHIVRATMLAGGASGESSGGSDVSAGAPGPGAPAAGGAVPGAPAADSGDPSAADGAGASSETKPVESAR